MDPYPIDVATLKQLAAWDRQLPDGPWQAVERSHLEVHGPQPWDPDVQPSREVHEAHEARRAATAAWRGLIDAQGRPLVGEALRGGAPTAVHDPTWRFLAQVRNDLPALLATLRTLWPRTDVPQAPEAAVEPTHAAAVLADDATVERAAQAAWEAVPSAHRWRELPDTAKSEWRQRVRAALDATRTG